MEPIWRVLGAITGSTAISFAIALLSAWVCWLQRAERDTVWKISCVTTFLGVLGVWFSIKEELAAQASVAAAAQQLADAQSRASAIEHKMAPRTIPPAIADKLVERLKAVPEPHSIEIFSVLGDSVSGELAEQFRAIFERAGWDAKHEPWELSPLVRGYALAYGPSRSQPDKPPEIPDNFREISEAFSGGGLFPLDLSKADDQGWIKGLFVFGKPDGPIPEGKSMTQPNPQKE